MMNRSLIPVVTAVRRPGPGESPAILGALLVAALVALSMPAAAHQDEASSPVVVDTDLGLDDAVALAMVLQAPDLEVIAAVAGEGVADSATATSLLVRLVAEFNRGDVPVFAAPVGAAFPPPAFRARARQAADSALGRAPAAETRRWEPEAYREEGHRTTILALGPLTRIADALATSPELAAGIGRVVVSGDPDDPADWNLTADRAASETLRSAAVEVVFVRPGGRGVKPVAWYTDRLAGGQRTAIGEALLDRLLADPEVRDHYLGTLASFRDELAALYLLRPELFTEAAAGVVEPIDTDAAAAAIADALSRGRQRKDRVVFVDGPLPAAVLRDDVSARREAILAANGPDEWFAQLLLNELHEHLGAYSIIGVKMGLRAAELLNAPQHAMEVVSSAPAEQPLSCLNDGLLVATGSTPGRGLFSHAPGPPGTVQASFAYNGRQVTLRLGDRYRARIRNVIQDLLEHATLEDDEYWAGVRSLGLDVWQSWHRRDLFEVRFAGPPESREGPGDQP